jgi:hypothetical protein
MMIGLVLPIKTNNRESTRSSYGTENRTFRYPGFLKPLADSLHRLDVAAMRNSDRMAATFLVCL